MKISTPTIRLVVLLLAAVAGVGVPKLRAADAPAGKPLAVCLVSGSLEYRSNESLDSFQKLFEGKYNARCTRAFVEGADESRLPGLENLDHCDVALLFTRRLKLEGEELDRIKRYCLAGKPIVGVRTASHAIQTWLELDKEVLGGNYHGHYGNDLPTEITVLDSAKSHPILRGFKPFRSAGSLYKNTPLADDVEVLLNGAIPEHIEPIAWTRNYQGARIFYTSLGHPQDFTEPSFQQLLVNALYWTARRTPEPH
jgi:type 1 glutamine amidotransferase